MVLVLGAWNNLVWMIGLLASFQVHPHLASASQLRVRSGARIDIRVPWDAIATVGVRRRALTSSVRALQPRQTETGTDLQVGVSGETNVHVVLRYPVTVSTPKGSLEITELSFFVDDARQFVTRARQRRDVAASSRRST
ncbi:MAG: hypothetical protein ACR2K2_08110 [Mycobacteriales bacterium]